MIKVANVACKIADESRLRGCVDYTHGPLVEAVARHLGIEARVIECARVARRSIDARKKSNVHFIIMAEVSLVDRALEKSLVESGRALAYRPYVPLDIPNVNGRGEPRVIVVGAGPAGLFAALYLARAGLRPLVVERGGNVDDRTVAVERFEQGGELDMNTNIQFGEGGAGTFSDGKLTTGVKHPMVTHVFEWFAQAGAPDDILWDAMPHIGSDRLPEVVRNLRSSIEDAGGQVRFNTLLDDVEFDDAGRVRAVSLVDTATGESSLVEAKRVILACGHSARDTFEMLAKRGIEMEQKPFAMGVRIEHTQRNINRSQRGDAAEVSGLGAAPYKLSVRNLCDAQGRERSCYTFCMCPGGKVVCAASEEGGVVTNGASDYARDGENANAGLLVNVDPQDLATKDPLEGMRLQRAIESRAFEVAQAAGGGPYQAPCQTVGDFLGVGDVSGDAVRATYGRKTVACDLRQVLPAFICDAIAEALPLLDKKLRGFADPAALMTAPETRSSSPVRIVRGESMQARVVSGVPCGIYPCGEGPGYAGGIVSAAADGLKVAERVAADMQRVAGLQGALDALVAGKPVVIPTDTVYGLGVSVKHARSLDDVYRIKHRDAGKPVAWLVSSHRDLDRFGCNVPEQARRLAQAFWPGALTIIVASSKEVSSSFASAQNTVGLRMPASETIRCLIDLVGGPVAASSANIAGAAAVSAFDELDPRVLESAAFALRDDASAGGCASTVVDCTEGQVRIVRTGPITPEQIDSVLAQ